MKFDYYYGSQADQFNFIKIPKALLTDKMFASLSLQAKMLYGILLDRMGLSRKNGWFDSENKAYIIYQISEIQEDLGFSKKKAIDYLSELEVFGLVEKKRRGRGLPSILYVKSFQVQTKCETSISQVVDISEKASVDVVRSDDMDTSRSAEMGTSRSADLTPQEVPKSTPLINNTNMNHTEDNNNQSNQIISNQVEKDFPESKSDTMRDMAAYEVIIRENICYDELLKLYPYDTETIEGIKQLILETVMCNTKSLVIASSTYPAELVKSKLLKLDYFHIQYVMECLKSNTSQIKNIKKYILAALFNAPVTKESYYRAEVNHNMAYI